MVVVTEVVVLGPDDGVLEGVLDAAPPHAHVEPGTRPPRRIEASWRRSQRYGVDLEHVDPAFTGTFDRESLFYECGLHVLTDLHRTLLEEPIGLMLTDSRGLVLARLASDPRLTSALDAVHLAEGFEYSEREVGTNGLGLALADRTPTLVRADQHYSADLFGYTCAAVPVLDPVSGDLEGTVNITTWSRQGSDLLLALAQSAATSTSALMLARAGGHRPRPQPLGEIYRVETGRTTGTGPTLQELSAPWRQALDDAARSVADGRVVALLGEAGSGRATLGAQAHRRVFPRSRILQAGTPAPADTRAWLDLWAPELAKPDTSAVVLDVGGLPLWAAEEVVAVASTRRVSVTARDLDDLPGPLAARVDAVVAVPPLRERRDDVVPLAEHLARRFRGRDVGFTAAARRALTDAAWEGNVDRLADVVREAVARADVVDVQHLPADVLSHASHRLTAIEALEREAIARALTRPGTTVEAAARELGMSRATIYRRITHYGLRVPGRAAGA